MIDKFVPESVRVKLVVGQRVRYVPNGECDLAALPLSSAARYQATGHEAYDAAEGHTGVIKSDTDSRHPGHPYLVHMDAPYQFGNRKTWDMIIAAAHELALVEDE